MPRCHCSYCYDYGHNKMGCPKAKAKANNPDEGDGTLSPMQQYDEYCEANNDPSPYLYSVRKDKKWNMNTITQEIY